MGNFKQMVRDITFDPGMLRYLNGYLNTKAAPDENYGRELQELFCIGKGPGSQYTCLLYTSPSPRDRTRSRMPSSA